MENVSKPWYQSKAIWGSLVAIAVSLAGAFGVAVPVGFEQEAVEVIMALVAALGGGVALYGRVAAKAPIAQPVIDAKKGKPLAVLALVALVGLGGCAQWDAGKQVAVDRASDLMDAAILDAEFVICRGASAGAVERRYGQSEELAKARRTICNQQGPVDVFAPTDEGGS